MINVKLMKNLIISYIINYTLKFKRYKTFQIVENAFKVNNSSSLFLVVNFYVAYV